VQCRVADHKAAGTGHPHREINRGLTALVCGTEQTLRYVTWTLSFCLIVSLAELNGMLREARECALNNTDKES